MFHPEYVTSLENIKPNITYWYNTPLYPAVDTDAFKLELTGKKSDPCDEEEGDVISGDVEVRLGIDLPSFG